MYLSAQPISKAAGIPTLASDRPHWSALARAVQVLPIAAIILPLLLTAGACWLAWRQAWHEAATEMTATAASGAEYARRLLDGIALQLDRGVDLLAGLDDETIRAREPKLHEALRHIPARTHDLGTVHLFAHDRNARPLVSGRLSPALPDIAFVDREFNQSHRSHTGTDLHVSPVYVGRATHRAFFALSRRRPDDPGRPGYNGIVAASVDVAELGAGLARLLVHKDDVLALTRSDGIRLARSAAPMPNGPEDRDPADSAQHEVMRRGEPVGLSIAPSPLNGAIEVGAMRRVEGWPVYVLAARARSAVIDGWWRTARDVLAIGVTATALLFVFALLLRRRDRALADANRALEQRVAERTLALAESEARLRRVQAIGRVGGFEIDLRTGCNLRSAEYMRLQGRPASPAQERHEDWVRRLHPDDRARAEARFLNAISDQSGETAYAQEYRIVAPDGSIRWIAARAEIERAPSGRALRMVGAHMDVTELRVAQDALAEREARLSAAMRGARLGVAEYHVPTRIARWDARTAEIFGGLPSADCTPGMMEWLSRIHADDAAGRRQAIGAAVRPGGPDSYDVEFRCRRADGGWNWVAVHGAVIERDPLTGRAIRLAGVVQDITERREAEERQRLLAREVDHRAKNALAVVLAMVRLAPRTDAASFASAIEGRVTALARTHTLLAEGRWTGASLRSLAEGELAPFLLRDNGADPDCRQVVLQGPTVMLRPVAAQALAMALHELATNATRHGALSVPDGRVRLCWETAAETGMLRILWDESGGPAVSAPTHRGFGWRVLEATVRDQLGGAVSREWRPEGLRCALTFPLDRYVETDPQPQA